MATTINRGSYPLQFDRELAKVFYGTYADLPAQWSKIAQVEDFPKGRYLSNAELSPLGNLRAMAEGEELSFDTPVEGHKKTIQTVKFGLGVQITAEALDDDLHDQLVKLPESLARSANYTIEQNFWNLFNNGFSSVTGWDGVSVFSASHVTLKSGATINNLGNADLSDTSLKAAFDYFSNLVDEAGMPITLKPNKLVIPNSLMWVANDLLHATGRVWDYVDYSKGLVTDGTNKFAPGQGPLANSLNPSNGVVDGWSVFASRYLTDDDAWFLIAPEHTFTFYWKKKPTMSSSDNFTTDSRLYKVVTRFATAVWDYKPVYGSPGA
jgi:hypothetical protein